MMMKGRRRTAFVLKHVGIYRKLAKGFAATGHVAATSRLECLMGDERGTKFTKLLG